MDYNGCLRDFRRKKDAGNVTSGCFRHLHISMEKCHAFGGHVASLSIIPNEGCTG